MSKAAIIPITVTKCDQMKRKIVDTQQGDLNEETKNPSRPPHQIRTNGETLWQVFMDKLVG